MGKPLTRKQMARASELSLVALAMSGDDIAFEELVRRRQTGIRSLLRQLSGEQSLADDFAQETFFRAWQKLRNLRSPGAFGGWLRRIAVNVFLQHIRKTDLSIKNSETVLSTKASNSVSRSTRMDLEKALIKLKPMERICIVLSYAERLSHHEICGVTDLPLGTVKSHISRGSARLRQYLKEYKDDF